MKILRHLSLLIIFCCAFSSSKAQWVTIPDTAFASFLRTNYPTCMNGNQMDTTCAGVVNAVTINCAYKNIHDIWGIQFFENLQTFNCDHNALTALPPIPLQVYHLNIKYNRLTSLPFLPDSVRYIEADSNLLSTLPALPVELLHLKVSNNQFTNLPSLPTHLEFFTCVANKLTTLPLFPSTLKQAEFGLNLDLDSIPPLPLGLTYLSCYGCFVGKLPALPSTLRWLDCNNNDLTDLPQLPAGLTSLGISNNYLTTLQQLPTGLTFFRCGNNNLDSLPALAGLTDLNFFTCDRNRLTALPALPVSVNYLNCSGNLLTSLPNLPDSLRTLICNDNPSLHCLPPLKALDALKFDSLNIACVPNYAPVTSSVPRLSNIPLCQPGNANGCASNWNIAGAVFNDTTADCAQQFGEDNVAFLKVQLLQNNNVVQQAYTGSYGVYSFLADTGNYTLTVDTTGLPFNILCPVSQYDSAAVDSGSLLNDKDFALQCKPGYDVAAFSVASNYLFRPAAYVPLKIHAGDNALQWRQRCNTTNLPGQLITTISGPATYKTPAPGALTPTSVAGNVLNYTITNWSGVNAFTDFNIVVQVDTTAQAGQQVCVDVQLTPTASDNDVANNQLTHCFNVVASYDPNIKEVYPASSVDIAGSRWLTYTVHFQNTGNSYAEHVFVTDTLDTDVDAETFQLLSYSFAPEVTLKGNAVRFNFYHIMLIDSTTDEPNSHGYVQYKVKVKDNATVGTVINNTAYIYFDFNAPVVTNTTTNTLTVTLPNGISTINSTATMAVYPNPASDMVIINLSDNLTGGTLTLSDVTGRALTTLPLTATRNQLNTAELSSGVYIVTAVKGGVRVVQRVTISH